MCFSRAYGGRFCSTQAMIALASDAVKLAYLP